MSSKRKKLFTQIFYTALGLWMLFLACVPTLLSKGTLKSLLNKNLPGNLSFEKAHLSWFGSQSLEGIEYQSPSQGLQMKIDSLTTQASLFNLILNRRDFKETHIKGLEGSMFFSNEKEVSLLAGLNPENASSDLSEKPPFLILSLPFIGKVHIDHSTFVFDSSEYDPITFSEIQLNCDMLSKSGPLLCNLACESSQKELSGSAFLNLELGGFDEESKLILTPFDKDVFFLAPKSYLQLSAQLTNLPTEGFDHLLHLYNPKFDGIISPWLGDSLNLGSQVSVIKGKSNLNMTASAPNLDLKFSGRIVQNEFFLDEASICNLKISPPFIQALSQIWGLDTSISKTSVASIHLDRLSLPLDFKNFNLSALSCNAQFSLGEMEFSKGCALENLKIQQVSGIIDTFDIGENVTFHVKAIAEDNQNPLLVKADGQISKLMNLQESKGIDQLQGDFQIELKDMPSPFLTYFSKNSVLYNEILGPTTHLNLKFNGSPSDGLLTLSLNSSRLDLPEAVFKLRNKNELTLTETSLLNYRLNPSLSKLFLNPKLTLLHPLEVQGRIKKLDLSLSKADRELSDIDMKFNLNTFETSFENSKPINIQETKIYISKNDQDKVETKAYFTALFPEEFDKSLLGNSFNLSLVFKSFPLFSDQTSKEVLGFAKGDHFSTDFEGLIDNDYNLHLTKASNIHFFPFAMKHKGLEISSKKSLAVIIEPCTLSLRELDFNKVKIKGALQGSELSLTQNKASYTFQDFTLPFEYFGFDKFLDFSLNSENKKIAFSGTLTQFQLQDLSNFDFHVHGKIKQASSNLFQLIQDTSLNYSALLGDSFDFNVDTKGQRREHFNARISYLFSSPTLKSHGEFTLNEELFLNDPISINYLLTPENYAYLSQRFPGIKESSLQLIEPAELKISLNRLHKKTVPLAALPDAFEGEIAIEQIITQNGELHHFEGHFATPNVQEILNLDIHAHTLLKDNDPGELSFKGDFIELMGTPHLNGYFTCKLHYFPTDLFHSLALPFSKTLANMTLSMGPVFNLTSSLKVVDGKGPLKLELQSNQLKTALNINFEKDHMTLNEDAEIELRLSLELSKDWLSCINPLLLSATHSDTPILLSIEKEGVYVPCAPFQIKELEIPAAQLQLGQLSLKEGSHLNQVFSLFNERPASSQLKSWFTPCQFSIEKGSLHLAPSHFQIAERFHLAVWGDWDFSSNHNSFFLGLPAPTLKTEFGLTELPEHYVFQIPFQSLDGNLQADWKLALKQLNILTSSSSPFAPLSESSNAFSLDQIMEVIADSQPSKVLDQLALSYPWKEVQEDFSLSKFEEPSSPAPSKRNEQTEILQNFFKTIKEKISH